MRARLIAAAALALAGGQAHAQAHMLSDCPGALVRAQSHPQTPPATEPEASAWALVPGIAAVCAARQGDFQRAEALFMAVLDARPLRTEPFALPLLRTLAQRNGDPALALRLLDAMDARSDQARRDGRPSDLDRVRRLASHERNAALALLGRADEVREGIGVRSSRDILDLQIDRRFESVWKSRAAVVDQLRDQAEQVRDYAARLRFSGEPGHGVGLARQALTAGDASLALALLRGEGQWTLAPPPAVFAEAPRDYEREYVWLRLLIFTGDLGDWTKIVGPREPVRDPYTPRAVKLLAMALVRADRPREALDLLDRSAPYLHPIDSAELPLLRACAMARAGKTAEPAAIPPFAEVAAVLDSLLCAGREDEAAALVVETLADPERRVRALRHLQHYAPPRPLGAFDRELRARRAGLLRRPQVKAAIDRGGRLLDLPIQEPD